MATRASSPAELDAGRSRATGAPIFKAIDAEMSVVPDSRRIRFVISDGAVDRDNDTIAADGWDLANYRKNPVVLFAHSHADLPIGKCVDVGVVNGQLVATAEFATAAENPMADQVYRLLKGGYMKATSVGFRALEYVRNEARQGIDFKKQELLEFSVVPVPANQNALMAAAAEGIDLEPLRKWVEATLLDWPGELRLKGRAWRKIQGDPEPAIARSVKIGDLESTVRVDTHEAIGELADLEAAIDRVAEKASKLDLRVRGLDESHGHTHKHTSGGDYLTTNGWRVGETAAAEPIRWNRSLSKAFDVAAQEFPAQSLEQELASKYLETPIRHLHHGEIRVRSAKMGAFLSALDEFLGDATVHVAAIRNIDRYGKEAPPLYEDIQLNSKLTRNFLVDGMRFFEWSGIKVCLRVEPRWYGLDVSHYSVREQQGAGSAALEKVQARAKSLNFLKGEAFTLGGEFLARGTETPEDLILDPKNQAAMARLLALVNSKGAEMECRGELLVGPPGTGKTLSGRILMNRAQATFIWVSSRDLRYSGGLNGIADGFELARENAPAVLFMEDIDNWLDGYAVDLLKTEMDGIKQHRGVLTVLTTNYPEQLPKALIDRPGRFHDVLRFDLPADAARKAMIEKWMPGLTAADVAGAVAATAGMSGAHMRELARFATILAEQDGLGKSAALAAALAKLQEQRDLITAVQASGSHYRAPAAVREKALRLGPAQLEAYAFGAKQEDEAGEEAAELVGYQGLATLLDSLAGLLAQGRALVAALIADETETPTETPEAEAAEDAVEDARLGVLSALCRQMMGALSGVCALADGLAADEEDDEPADAPMPGMPGMGLAAKAVPPNVSTAMAPKDQAWTAPALGDFTAKAWGDLSDAEKRKIAGHFAFAKTLPPATFGDLHLPHHDPKTGQVVLRGVIAAAGRLGQAQGLGADLAAVKAHLRRHYAQFGMKPPDALRASVGELVAKRGRVLSAANEQKLRKAMDHSTNCQKAIDEVLQALPQMPQAAAGARETAVLELAEADEPFVELIEADFVELAEETDGMVDVDADGLRAVLAEVVGGAMSEMVRQTTERTLNQMRGRVD